MRFVCDRCKSKYSISDDKVRGKILKIRCKRCNHIIEVRDPVAVKSTAPPGPMLAAPLTPPPSERRPTDMPEERTQISSPGLLDELKRTAANLALQPSAEPVLSEWYVAIEDEPTGPITREEVRAHIAAGRVGSESLVWREGFDDWRPLREVPDLRDLLRGSRALSAVAAPPRSRASAPAQERGRPSSGLAEVIPLRRQADTTPSPPRETSRPTLERVPQPDHSPPPAPPFGGGSQAHVAVPLRGREVGRLGQRPRTGSVAVPLGGRQVAAPPPPPVDAAPALSELVSSPGTPAPPRQAADTSLAGLVSAAPPAFDASDGGSAPFAIPEAEQSPVPPPPPPMDVGLRAPSPSMLPIVQQATSGRRRMSLALLIAGAVLFGVVGAVVVVKMTSAGPEPVAEGATEEPRRPMNLVDTPVKAGGDPAIKGLMAGPDDAVEEPDDGEDPSGPAKGAGVRGGARPTSGGGAKGKALTEEEERLLAAAKALGGSGGPVPAKTKEGGSGGTSAAGGGRPLSGEQVRSTVGRNMGSIQRCYEREMRGTKMQRDLRVLVRMRIGTSGRVSSATVGTGTVRGTSLGNCIEGAVRRWVFPTATGESNVEIPIVLTPRR